MKLSTVVIMASSVASAAASTSISGKNAAKVLRAARKLEDGNADDAQQEEDYAFVAKYTLKMISCQTGQKIYNADGNGEYESNAAVFRLCPTESGCDDSAVKGCSKGYGDYVVGLNTFVDAYFEDQRDNMQWDDNFEVDKYAQCDQYKIENNNDDGNKWENYQFWIGPTCTADGTDVKLELFTDETCTTASEDVSFSDISGGWTLPYSDGGIVSTSCINCYGANENGEYELREMCQNLYQQSAYNCEEKMEYYSYYGQNNQGCDTIAEMLPKAKKSSSGSGGKVFGWILFIAIVVGLAGYIVWWRKSKSEQALEYDYRPPASMPQRRSWRFWKGFQRANCIRPR